MLNKLKYWLKPVNVIFNDFRLNTLDVDDVIKHRIFIDRESDILFVAHLDTVQKPEFIRETKARIYATGLDDRLGCLIAYELSEELNADLLLSDHEETFRTTAQYHDYKDYKWIVEFDRYRDDVVLYNCGSKEFESVLNKYWKVGQGSFSDICLMDVGCCCMNLGIGYYNAHETNSYCVIKTVYKQVEKFRLFYAEYKDTAFIRDIPFMNYHYAYDNYESDDALCEICNWNVGTKIYDIHICEDCLNSMIIQYLYKTRT